ncbi:MAG: trehalose-6-phosphate synthase, partial [Firmicutes bacterium]|nr:trehalose-6-phosphate synthase [Bacillota bacterium]
VYRRVNQKFARTVTNLKMPHARVFSHDFHLALFPSAVRKMNPMLSIAHFWHIPWPPYTVFRLCPQHQEIFRGLLGANVIGFQSATDTERFLTGVERSLKVPVNHSRGTILWKDRTVYAKSFPISVNIQEIEQLVQTPAVSQFVHAMRARLAQRQQLIGISVDRADYTKGILQRLQALNEFFVRYPQNQGHVVFLQIIVPTRTGVDGYRQLFQRVVAESSRINQRFAQNGWRPIITIRHGLDRKRIMGLFRMVDFALISSLFDGMNLVAKEFIAAQVDRHGVLLLSESTGAAQELAQYAFPVNPLDPEGFAHVLQQALHLPAAERIRRMRAMQNYLHQHSIHHWIQDILNTLQEATETYVPN